MRTTLFSLSAATLALVASAFGQEAPSEDPEETAAPATEEASADEAKEGEEDFKTFSAEHVFDLEYADDPQISPDGASIVYVRQSMDKFTDRVAGQLWEVDLETGDHRPMPGGEGAASGVRWSPSGDRVVFMAGGERPELRVLYRDTGQSFSLAQLEEGASAPTWSPDGTMVAFAMMVPEDPESFAPPLSPPEGANWSEPFKVFSDITFRFDGAGYLDYGTTHVFVVPAEGGTPRQVTEGDAEFGNPVWLDDETLLVVGNEAEDRDLDVIESEIYAVDLATLERTPLTDRDGPDFAPAVSPDTQHIAYLGYDDKVMSYQQTDLYVMTAEGDTELLTEQFDRSIGSFTWAPDGESLLAMVEMDGDLAIVQVALNGETKVLSSDAGGTSIGRPYASGAFSVNREGPLKIAYTQARTETPAELAVLVPGEEPERLTHLNDDVLPYLDIAEIEEIKIESSAGGIEIEGWVALPPGFEADGSYPLILEIHGGPFAQYGPYFAAEIQRYAAEGYVTAYVNPRGSTGYGEEFAQLIDLAYPGEDYDDLMSFVDELIDRDYVDPNRLFVTGGSGGGVLTSWIVGKTDRFAAAATIKPVINWETMALAGDIAPFVARHWMKAMPWEEPERYRKLSPISIVGNVVTPTLVMVGEEDWRTPTWEAEQFYTALKLQEIDSALIRIPGSSHAIASRPSRLIGKVDNIMGWFAKYDPANAETDEAEDE